jgi:hypothetical protein
MSLPDFKVNFCGIAGNLKFPFKAPELPEDAGKCQYHQKLITAILRNQQVLQIGFKMQTALLEDSRKFRVDNSITKQLF